MLTQEYTKVHWKVSEGRIVVKFKVGLEKLCKNLAETMENVEGDLKRMLFWKVQQKSSVKSSVKLLEEIPFAFKNRNTIKKLKMF